MTFRSVTVALHAARAWLPPVYLLSAHNNTPHTTLSGLRVFDFLVRLGSGTMKKDKKPKKSDATARLPAISWVSNGHFHTWRLLAEVEDNRTVLIGAGPGQVCYVAVTIYSSADTA